MSIIYTICQPEDPSDLVASIQGDFAVRSFASLASFNRVAQVSRGAPPDGVITKLPSSSYSIEHVDLYLEEQFPGALRVFLRPDYDQASIQGPGRFLLPMAIAPMRLSLLLKRWLEYKARSSDVMYFKDLKFDLESLMISDIAGSMQEQLTLREGQLLRFFMRNKEELIHRKQIREAVWQQLQVSPRTIDSQISKLRKRLKMVSVGIESVYGGGYIFK